MSNSGFWNRWRTMLKPIFFNGAGMVRQRFQLSSWPVQFIIWNVVLYNTLILWYIILVAPSASIDGNL